MIVVDSARFNLLRARSAAAVVAILTCAATAQPLDMQLLKEIGLDQNLDTQIPLDLTFTDEKGRTVSIGDLLGDRPALLTLVYYECPMLCTQILNGLTRSLRVLSFDVGKEFDVITVSIDPGETSSLAAAKKEEYVKRYGRVSADRGWHFLTGRQDQIDRLAQAVGFRYQYDPENRSVSSRQRHHAADPRGEAGPVLLWSRIRSQGRASWTHRGIAGQNRLCGGPVALVVLSVRPVNREVRSGNNEFRAHRRRADGSDHSVFHCPHAAPGAPRETEAPDRRAPCIGKPVCHRGVTNREIS